jgi:hypothetical protein
MRFFSNESKETNDDQDVDVPARAGQENPPQAHDDSPDRVQSDPVAVPQQRAGSPWSSAPADGDDAPPPFHEPGPQPTAFGASTVGGAVAASAVANPANDTWQPTDRDSAANDGVGDDRSVAPGDGAVNDDTTQLPTAGSHRVGQDDVVDVALDDRGSFDDPKVKGETRTDDDTHTVEDTTPPDTSLTGATGTATGTPLRDEGDFTDPKAVDPATGQTLESDDRTDAAVTTDDRAATDADGRTDTGDRVADEAIRDEGGFADPTVVDPATGQSLDADADTAAPTAADTGAEEAGKPGSVAEPAVAALFAGTDAQAFRDRWRDVQLRFVDSPKEATAEAAGLVDEAADRLAAALKAQKAKLGGDHDDTEKLRVELRGYREMLNRILDL